MTRSWIAAFYIGFVTFGAAAQAEDYRPGDKVVVIAEADLIVDQDVVDHVGPGSVLKVEDINDTWLWVAVTKPGWLESRNVIPLDRRAIDSLTEMIRRQPRSARLYDGRAEVWMELGELDIALADLNEAVRLSPESAIYGNRGRIWEAKGEFDKAIADYDEALRLDPANATAHHNRGMAWYKKRDLDQAIADFTEADPARRGDRDDV